MRRNSGPIHPSAWNRISRKFAKKVSNITHLSDTLLPTPGVCCQPHKGRRGVVVSHPPLGKEQRECDE
jgi:hypothetical protein